MGPNLLSYQISLIMLQYQLKQINQAIDIYNCQQLIFI